jgi:hypothetical protein
MANAGVILFAAVLFQLSLLGKPKLLDWPLRTLAISLFLMSVGALFS